MYGTQSSPRSRTNSRDARGLARSTSPAILPSFQSGTGVNARGFGGVMGPEAAPPESPIPPSDAKSGLPVGLTATHPAQKTKSDAASRFQVCPSPSGRGDKSEAIYLHSLHLVRR